MLVSLIFLLTFAVIGGGYGIFLITSRKPVTISSELLIHLALGIMWSSLIPKEYYESTRRKLPIKLQKLMGIIFILETLAALYGVYIIITTI